MTKRDKSEETTTFSSIGDLAKADVERLRARRNEAFDAAQWEIAETYHYALITAEIEELEE